MRVWELPVLELLPTSYYKCDAVQKFNADMTLAEQVQKKEKFWNFKYL